MRAKPADRHLDGGGERVGVLVPDSLEQLLGRDDAAVGAEQVLEHGELLGAERQALPAAAGEAVCGVDAQVAVHERGRQGGAGAAGERPHPRDELGEGERLGQVVVGSEAEAVDAVFDRAGGGEHQDAPVASLGDERAADPIAVHAWQVPVEHEHVVVGERQVRERVVPVERDVDGHALAAQPCGDRVGKLGVILDQ